jgi:ABC-type multidrug transport system ATPase subunit
VRRAVAYVPRAPLLPEALTVSEVLHVAATIRGDSAPDVDARLAPFGIASLASRRVRTLSAGEVRALALAEALGSSVARVVLIDEPLASVDGRAVAGVRQALAARVRGGTCVLFATASPSDAASMAASVMVLFRGKLVAQDASPAEAFVFSAGGAELRIIASDARALVAALATDAAITGVETQGASVVVRGPDPSALAAAVARAAVLARVDVHEMRAGSPPLEQLQAAATGAAMATYHAAYARAYGHARSPSPDAVDPAATATPDWKPGS